MRPAAPRTLTKLTLPVTCKSSAHTLVQFEEAGCTQAAGTALTLGTDFHGERKRDISHLFSQHTQGVRWRTRRCVCWLGSKSGVARDLHICATAAARTHLPRLHHHSSRPPLRTIAFRRARDGKGH